MSDQRGDRLEQLREEADVLAQQVEAAQAASSREQSGEDSTGAVTVRLAADGSIHDIEVDQAWREVVALERLGDAVVEAYGAAVTLRLEDFSAAFDAEQERPPAPRPPSGADVAGEIERAIARDERFDDDGLESVIALLAEINDSLDHFTEQLETITAVTHTGRSRAGHVRATVGATGELAGITYDARWLVGAHEFNIGRETTEAVRDAVGKAGRHSLNAALADTQFGRLTADINDPATLLRRFRS